MSVEAKMGKVKFLSNPVRPFFLVFTLILTAAPLSSLPSCARISGAAVGHQGQGEIPAAFGAAVKAADENLKSVNGLMFSGAFFAELQPWLEQFLRRRLRDVVSAGGEGEVAVSIQSAGGGTHLSVRAYIEPFSVLVRIGEFGETEEVVVWPITEVARQLKSEFPKAGHPSPPSPAWWLRIDFKVEAQKAKGPQLEKVPEAVQYPGGIVYGGELAVAVIAPDGWVLDNKSGVSQGTHAVLYPRGSSWKDAPEVMYVNTGQIESGGSIDTVIAEDVDKFKKKFPRVNIETLEPIATKSGAQAQVRAFSGGGYLNYEAVAYARLGNDVALYALTCRDKSGYDRTISLFRDMVSSSVLGPISLVREILEQRSRDVIIFPGTVKAGPEAKPDNAGAWAGIVSFERPDGYKYWSQFVPSTYIVFRYGMKSTGSSLEILKKFTLQEVSPEAVVLEYAESPFPPLKNPVPPGMSSVYRRSYIEFRQADESFKAQDLLGGELGFHALSTLSDSRGARAFEGFEEFELKGTKVRASRVKMVFGSRGTRSTITLWLSEQVPGKVVKFVREIEGDVAFREEVQAEEFVAIKAEPAELGRLWTGRKPAVVKTSGISYVTSRFRIFDSLGTAFKELSDSRDTMFSLLPKGVDTDWAVAKARVLPFQDKFQRLNSEIDEDERKATAELGGEEIAKLAPFLKHAKRYCAVHVKELEIILDLLTKLANNPSDDAPFASSKEELANVLAEMKAVRQDFVEELRKLNEVKVKFIKNPGS